MADCEHEFELLYAFAEPGEIISYRMRCKKCGRIHWTTHYTKEVE